MAALPSSSGVFPCLCPIPDLCQTCSLWPLSADGRIDRKKDKAERKILDSQERAFWDVHRPVVSAKAILLSRCEENHS